jgi:uncharacterized membrane protein YjdF
LTQAAGRDNTQTGVQQANMSHSVSTIYDEAMHDDHRPRRGGALRGSHAAGAHRLIAITGTVALIVIALTARVETYRVSAIFLVPLLWMGYALRERLAMGAATYAAFLVAILLHDMGAYGWYQNSPLPFSWDIFVHFYFAIPGALIIRGALRHHFPMLSSWQVSVTTLLFVMGFGALHEIVEFASYGLLGNRGMLKSTSYVFDTSRDLTNNLLGCLAALAMRSVLKRFVVPRESKRRGFDVLVSKVPHQK